ncbi:MAG: HD domain-containing protein [Eudoraea sp.]|nr:HD domain-containing protein [Eudoraea sp.]
MKGYIKLRRKVNKILETNLPNKLYYHALNHTDDVLKVCNDYIRRDKINSRDAKLLRIGALLHDIGFTETYENHEAKGQEIAQELMGDLEFSQKDIDVVKGLIWATKIPQSPKTKLEKIICDADLDYLGRRDFYKISDKLFKELKLRGLLGNKEEWNSIQIKFLEGHSYHTKFALENRQPVKEKRIAELYETL